MRKVVVGLLGAVLVTSVGIMLPAGAHAAPPIDPAPAADAGKKAATLDDLPNPLEDKRRALRTAAVSDVVSGKATPVTKNGSTVVKLGRDRSLAAGKDQYVELSRKRTDRIFVILVEFGNQRDPAFPDVDTDPSKPGPTTYDGPLHNSIQRPDRTKNNSKIWQADYDVEHYRHLYFGTGPNTESLKTYMQAQSSGRYSVDGQVTDWVKVPYNEARYGRNVCGGVVCSNTWALIRDAANQWVADQKAAGRTDAQIAAELKSFDQYDRYDHDGDGNFNEPDGYLDHFQIVHAGGDEADGEPQQGEDAIWSHRWYAYPTDQGVTGPPGNRLGGTEIGHTGMWIGDYTIQPENGGLSVFTHEYTHDLGLPDDYDTSGLGDNNNEFWTLMAQSRLNAPGEPLGARPGDLGAWNKLQLGWLDYTTVKAGQSKTVNLGPEEYHTTKPQAVVVTLPKKRVTTEMGAPYAGGKQFFSGNIDNLDSSLSHDVDLTGKTSASVTLKGRYRIEKGFDFLYFEASPDNGASWNRLGGTVDGVPIPNDPGGKPALTGSSAGNWSDIAIPLDAYAGKVVKFRLHYITDGATSAGGFFGDDLSINAGGRVLTDGAEGATTWRMRGFSIVGARLTGDYANYYIAGNRTDTSYDRYLQSGPFNFGWNSTRPQYVEHFHYQTGLLISYWDTSQTDNNTHLHPGVGRNLYIDSHPKPFHDVTGFAWRARVQIYDAPFSLWPTDGLVLHVDGRPSPVYAQPPAPLFDDKDKYYYAELPNQGVKLPAVGVKIAVLSQNGTSMTVRVS